MNLVLALFNYAVAAWMITTLVSINGMPIEGVDKFVFCVSVLCVLLDIGIGNHFLAEHYREREAKREKEPQQSEVSIEECRL